MQRQIVEPKQGNVIYANGRMTDQATGKLILWCAVCKRWFLSDRLHTITCGDACRKSLSRERKS